MWYEDLLDNPEAEAEFDAYMTRLFDEAIEATEPPYEEITVPDEAIPF